MQMWVTRWAEQKHCSLKLCDWPLRVSERGWRWEHRGGVAAFQTSGYPPTEDSGGPTYFPVRTSPSFTLKPGSLPGREVPQGDGDLKDQPVSLPVLLRLAGPKYVLCPWPPGRWEQGDHGERGWCLLGLTLWVLML